MRAYAIYAKNAFLSGIAYRFDTVFSALSGLIRVYVQIAVWQALYSGASAGMATGFGTIALNDMIQYVIVSTAVALLTSSRVILEMDKKIKSGEIAFDINRPVSLWGTLLCRTVGNNLFSFLAKFSPVALCVLPFFPLALPEPGAFALFLVSTSLGLITRFLLAFTLGLLGFWYLRIWHMDRLLYVTVGFFSGGFVPLWFFPKAVGHVAQWLPFKGIAFVPISIFLGKISGAEALWQLAQQGLWIAVLATIAYGVWRRGISKLVVQGG